MRINNNIMALNATRQLGVNNANANKSMEKLSSGVRINRAADDAAGLVIAEKMRSQVKGLNQASKNSQEGISLLQTAEGGLTEIHSVLQRMRELAVQASTGTLQVADKVQINEEFTQLQSEVGDIATKTQFNGMHLLDATGGVVGSTPLVTDTFVIQTGASAGEDMDIAIADMQATALGINASTVATTAGAAAAITSLDAAVGLVSSERANVGALSNRLEYKIRNLDTSSENIQAAESRIRDVDMAKEMMEFTKNDILQQAAQAMLAKANQAPMAVLQLLR